MNISEIESLSDLKGRIVVATKFGHKIINGKRTDWILIENKGYNLKSLPAEFFLPEGFYSILFRVSHIPYETRPPLRYLYGKYPVKSSHSANE